MARDSDLPFPDFLAPDFSPEELGRAESTIAVIESQGSILWVNPAWCRFADENGGVRERVTAGSYFEGIAPPLRGFYESAFGNALLTGEVFEHEYECSSAQELRRFRLRALPIAGRGLLIEHSLVVAQPHEPGSNEAAAAYLDEEGLVVQCSNCRRVRRPSTHAWDWVPALVSRIHPRTSHGLCASCVGFYWGRRARKGA